MGDRSQHPRYALIVRLPRQIEVRIEDRFLSLLGTSKPSMGYHITLVGPYFWIEESGKAMLDQVSCLCKSWEPFQVRITELSAFHTANANAVYIRASECAEIIALHEALLHILDDHINLQRELPAQGYIPHVTLGLGLTDRELTKVMESAHDQGIDERFTIEEISLVEQKPREPWRNIATFPLHNQRNESDKAVE